jgi:hypothetical protein
MNSQILVISNSNKSRERARELEDVNSANRRVLYFHSYDINVLLLTVSMLLMP